MKTVSTHRPLFIAAVALVALPFLVRALGLSIDSATVAVILAIATTGLNLCVGYTGLVSFGHSAWFGIGAYAAALLQRNVFPGEIWLPLIGSMLIVAALATVVGVLILRRRGVYFSLLTLALAALTYTIAFRWSDVTGGEDPGGTPGRTGAVLTPPTGGSGSGAGRTPDPAFATVESGGCNGGMTVVPGTALTDR